MKMDVSNNVTARIQRWCARCSWVLDLTDVGPPGFARIVSPRARFAPQTPYSRSAGSTIHAVGISRGYTPPGSYLPDACQSGIKCYTTKPDTGARSMAYDGSREANLPLMCRSANCIRMVVFVRKPFLDIIVQHWSKAKIPTITRLCWRIHPELGGSGSSTSTAYMCR